LFARELAARTNRALACGIKPIALALVDTDAPPYFDLLVKHQLAFIRTRTNKLNSMGESLQPRVARYGIWEAEPTMLIPGSSRWLLRWTTRRTMQRAIDERHTVHVAVNAAAMSQNSSAALSALDHVLKIAAVRRDAGQLQMVSASELLDLYSPCRERLISRSVLRAA
jgi:hypothetical protein